MVAWTEHTLKVNTGQTSRLILHCGANHVENERAWDAPTPEPYGENAAGNPTMYPIPHKLLRDTVVDALTEYNAEVVDEVSALWPAQPTEKGWGLRYFGLLLLEIPDHDPEKMPWQFTLGLRNAHDKSFSASGLLGVNISNCDNQWFAGGGELHFARKHTRMILRDLEPCVRNELGKLAGERVAIQERWDAYRDYQFDTPQEVHDFLVRAAQAGACAWQAVPKVLHEWDRDDGCGGIDEPGWNDRSGLRMMNAFTEVDKLRPSLLQTPRRHNRLNTLLDAQCGLDLQTVLAQIPVAT